MPTVGVGGGGGGGGGEDEGGGGGVGGGERAILSCRFCVVRLL